MRAVVGSRITPEEFWELIYRLNSREQTEWPTSVLNLISQLVAKADDYVSLDDSVGLSETDSHSINEVELRTYVRLCLSQLQSYIPSMEA